MPKVDIWQGLEDKAADLVRRNNSVETPNTKCLVYCSATLERFANHNSSHDIAELLMCHVITTYASKHPSCTHTMKWLMWAHLIMLVDKIMLMLLVAFIQNLHACLTKLLHNNNETRRHPHPKHHSRHYWYRIRTRHCQARKRFAHKLMRLMVRMNKNVDSLLLARQKIIAWMVSLTLHTTHTLRHTISGVAAQSKSIQLVTKIRIPHLQPSHDKEESGSAATKS